MVGLNPASISKINWTQVIAVAAMLGTVFGLDISPEKQVAIVATITGLQGVVTMILRTFFTGTAK